MTMRKAVKHALKLQALSAALEQRSMAMKKAAKHTLKGQGKRQGKSISKKARPVPPEGHYTYRVVCSFELQYTFDQSEVEADPEGDGEKDFSPTEDALEKLAGEMTETLSYNWPISSLEAWADSSDLLGVD